MSSKERYQVLPTDEPERKQGNSLLAGRDGSYEDENFMEGSIPQRDRKRDTLTGGRRLLLVLIISNISILLLMAGVTLRTLLPMTPEGDAANRKYATTKNKLLKEVSYYSPYYDQIELPLKDVKIDGPFVDDTYPQSIFKQPPSPEVDKAWKRLYAWRYHILTADQVRALGKDPKYAVKAPPEWGYGDDAYISRTDVAHRIHCLDMIRKATYPDSYYSHEKVGSPAAKILFRPHVMHCIHVLLQNLMCTATLEAVTYNWMGPEMYYPQADFSVNRKCVDMEAIIEWEEREGMPDFFNDEEKVSAWLDNIPEDVPRIPTPQPYIDLFNGSMVEDINLLRM